MITYKQLQMKYIRNLFFKCELFSKLISEIIERLYLHVHSYKTIKILSSITHNRNRFILIVLLERKIMATKSSRFINYFL